MWIKYIAAALLLGLALVRLTSKSSNAGFGSLGLVTGLALGLSASPVVAAAVTAVFTLAGVLVPLYFRGEKDAEASSGSSTSSAQAWLGPLATWLAVGLIMGVFLRANDALNFSENLRTHYSAQGFTDAQVDSIMAAHAATVAAHPLAVTSEQGKTNLQANEREEGWNRLLSDLVRPNDTPEKNVERVKKGVAQEDLLRIQWLESRGTPAAQILEVLKTWHSEEKSGGNTR